MANRTRQTIMKREKEKKRQQKAQEKAARRLEVKARKVDAPPGSPDEDPDIAGIIPGPQPIEDYDA